MAMTEGIFELRKCIGNLSCVEQAKKRILTFEVETVERVRIDEFDALRTRACVLLY